MSRRLDLQVELEKLCPNVYFQPPPSLQMKFPCIVYERRDISTQYADNKPYIHHDIYRVIYIDKDPESDVPKKILDLPMSTYETQYKKNEMYYNVSRITY